MNFFTAVLAALSLAGAVAANAATATAPAPPSNDETHRFLIERTFPRGALDGLDAVTKEKVNANNASVGVQWMQSYANADKTKTYCVYQGPNERAIRKAAELNALPIDRITEIPVDLDSGTGKAVVMSGANHRYLIERTFKPGELEGLDVAGKAKINATNERFGVHWVRSYANADRTRTYCLYEGPSEAAVRKAADANGISAVAITEVPVTLLPN